MTQIKYFEYTVQNRKYNFRKSTKTRQNYVDAEY